MRRHWSGKFPLFSVFICNTYIVLCVANKTFPFLILWFGCVFWFHTYQETNPVSDNVVSPLFLPSFWQCWTQTKGLDALIGSLMICSIPPYLRDVVVIILILFSVFRNVILHFMR